MFKKLTPTQKSEFIWSVVIIMIAIPVILKILATVAPRAFPISQ